MPRKGPNVHHSNTASDSADQPLKDRLRAFRDSRGLSRADLASQLSVAPVTLYRWETGSTRPSPMAAERLRELGFGQVARGETNAGSVPRLDRQNGSSRASQGASRLRDNAWMTLDVSDPAPRVLPAPFVRNGPPDQADFHGRLLALQCDTALSIAQLAQRLSMVESVDGFGETAQHSLDRPKPTAVSWNSNYGTHGWHRYVGRFPPHVIRALLNHFGAGRSSVVLDPFAGSGTTGVECRLLGIPFVGIEICPLSAMMTRAKASFPADPKRFRDLATQFSGYFQHQWKRFLARRKLDQIDHRDVLRRIGNPIPTFVNIERWFTAQALLGVSIAVQFGLSLDGFDREAVLLAVSSRMRSIGNVDVDVVRAEYRKTPRADVDVHRLVVRALNKMAKDVDAIRRTHATLIGPPEACSIHEGSVLEVDLPEKSIDYVITSPPYGVEAISYLRTHLLSYRSLVAHLQHDPYETRDKTIGSEYLSDACTSENSRAIEVSKSCRDFFANASDHSGDKKYRSRHMAMRHFFDDLLAVAERLSVWLKDSGRVAFIVGNKRLGQDVIPAAPIVRELFESAGFKFLDDIRHKLKTNNSNSQVPWQARTIQEESILLFKRRRRAR